MTVGLLPENMAITVYSGDRFDLQFTFDNGATPPVALNLTAYTFTAQVRSSPTAAVFAASFAVDATNAATGIIALSLTPTQTTALLTAAAGGASSVDLTWDLQRVLTADATQVRTLFAGPCFVTLDRTRP